MKTKKQILAWLDKQPWKGEFYEAAFLCENQKRVYNANFLISAFHWGETVQGETIWSERNKEYQKWYNSNDKPMSWEEYCEQYPVQKTDWFISDYCRIIPLVTMATGKRVRKPDTDVNAMSKDHCEAFLAYMKLIQLRNAWVKESDGILTYRLITFDHQLYVRSMDYDTDGLSFPTRKMAEEFLQTFKDLLDVAKPLL